MCGRAKLSADPEELAEIFDLIEEPALAPHWNIAPTQPMAIVREPRKLEFARFGFVPSFAKSPKEGTRYINARAETVQKLAVFREAFKSRRCLVVVDGFYEWKRDGKIKQPYLIEQPDGKPFALAGLWSTWTSRETGEVIESCTVITKAATGVVATMHDREPVTIAKAEWARWLAKDAEVADLLEAPSIELVAKAVTSHVNSAANDDEECVREDPRPVL
ncbi:MAG TPA: SOS response-associated peptidase [Polyangiaceae bacterium]